MNKKNSIDNKWEYCPNNPNLVRKIIGVRDDGSPIVLEKDVRELTNKELNEDSFQEQK